MGKMELFFLFAIIINTLSFLAMYIDKQKAIKHKWRISERFLISLALLGGSLGTMGGMKIFRHKTNHAAFSVGVPLILSIQILILLYSFAIITFN